MTTSNICCANSAVKGMLPRHVANLVVQRDHKETLQRKKHLLGRLMGKLLP